MTSLALLLGFALDYLLGDPPAMPHLVVAMGRTIQGLEGCLSRRLPPSPRGRLGAGSLLVFLVLLVWTILPLGLLWSSYALSPWLGLAVETFVIFQLLAARSLKTESVRVYRDLEAGRLDQARLDLARIVGRDTSQLDAEAISRAAVETVAENTSDGVVAPLFYLALAGPLGGCLYKAVNTMDSMLGYRNDRYLFFGRPAARLDDGVNWIPARLTGILMVASSALLGLDRKAAWQIYRRDRKQHASPNAGHPEAAMAGALGIQLGGPASYGGRQEDKPSLGDPRRPIQARDILQANRLMYMTSLLMLVLAIIFRLSLIGGLAYAGLWPWW